jgi:hypothetical protein
MRVTGTLVSGTGKYGKPKRLDTVQVAGFYSDEGELANVGIVFAPLREEQAPNQTAFIAADDAIEVAVGMLVKVTIDRLRSNERVMALARRLVGA